MNSKHMIIFCLLLIPFACATEQQVKPGIDILLEEHLDLVTGKSIGLITNPTGLTHDMRSSIDALHENPEITLTALFGPEHGVRGDIEGGYRIENYVDEKTGIQVFSLYGATRKPTPDMLDGIDVLMYDIQDIGSRAYTYIYTMALAMKAAAEHSIPFIVLDRPNPLGGELVEGDVLDTTFSSFIGMYPIPYVYGMTVGELALLFNEEFDIHCDLTVITMKNWKRSMRFEQTGLHWVLPSPHVPRSSTSDFVATTGCIGELGTVSIGVGYTLPFELVGAPWIEPEILADELNSQNLAGVEFRPLYFRPFYYHFEKEQCGGVQIHITDYAAFSPFTAQIHILTALTKLFPEHDIFDTRRITSFDKAFGTDQIRVKIRNGISADEILQAGQNGLNHFLSIRSKYLLYE
ncbi:MAG: DUF1343 domain-containing protein [candidate division KSB1 bacterium]|jgi:uncharacterized protein YbbC (DUF1343 family)|nr:DUF1343 domain-containing protein [candidate division KSB1 bacterium]